MTDSAQYTKQVIADVNALWKLKATVDPASGMTVAVRRGVARDNADDERDAERRPWTTIEMNGAGDSCTAIKLVIDQLIADRLESLRFRIPIMECDIRVLREASDAAQLYLAGVKS